MLNIQLSKDAHKFLSKLSQKKHLFQIRSKIETLKMDPFPHDSRPLQGDLKGRYRVDIGEYRIIYLVDLSDLVLKIVLIGKRNDGEVYKKAIRK